MGFWNYFVGEAYCLYSACKDKKIKVCEIKDVRQFFKDLEKSKRIKRKIIKNSSYINKKTFCKSPGRMTREKVTTCFGGEKQKRCPFFGFVMVDKEDFVRAVKAIKKSAISSGKIYRKRLKS